QTNVCLSTVSSSVTTPRSGNGVLFHTPSTGDSHSFVPRFVTSSKTAGAVRILDLGDGVVAFVTSEAAQGRDLNGDGDKLDNVLQAFESSSGVVRNSRQA